MPPTALSVLAQASDSNLLAARNQMALSLGWHIVLACFGVALPTLIFILHRRGLAGDQDALELARRWSKVAAVLFAAGAVSGTILSFELGLLWPGLMGPFGDVLGLPFALEAIAFFLEAIFLGIYLYGWKRLPGQVHSLMLIPVMVSGAAGTFFVVAVNAWMNAPSGFDLVDGEVTNVDPLAAMFNDAVPMQFLHMLLAAYMVVGFIVAGVYARGWLRGRTDRLHRLGILVPLAVATVATPLQPLVGHLAGNRIADDQPVKLAAMEGLAETDTAVDVEIGGWFIDGELRGAIPVPIPGLLSALSQNDLGFDAEVIGLDAVPPEDRPPVNVVRTAFQLMVGIGTALVGLVAWFAWSWRRRRSMPQQRAFLWALVAAGPAATIALEAGWVTTEVGRQPWVVHEVVRTREAVTDAGWIWLSFAVLAVVYLAMTVAGLRVIRSMSARWQAGEKDMPSPYGPAAPLASVGER